MDDEKLWNEARRIKREAREQIHAQCSDSASFDGSVALFANDGLFHGDKLRQEILDRMHYRFLQTDMTMRWPSSYEGDVLKMVYRYLTEKQ
jgi:hypothetical protein